MNLEVGGGLYLEFGYREHQPISPSKPVTLNEVHGDDLWSVITPGDVLERRADSNDLERSKAPKDHHCVEAASHWLLSGRRDP